MCVYSTTPTTTITTVVIPIAIAIAIAFGLSLSLSLSLFRHCFCFPCRSDVHILHLKQEIVAGDQEPRAAFIHIPPVIELQMIDGDDDTDQ